jgi:transcriptional regulator with XRE-family HTH domain
VPKQLKRRSDTPASALGAVLTDLRLRRGWGYQYVAHKLGCSPGYMNDMEHGKRNPTLKLLQAIADLHGIKLSRLIAMSERTYERGAKTRAAKSAGGAKSGKNTK